MNPYALRCEDCGQFVGYHNHMCYTPYGNSYDVDPPDEIFVCLSCWDEQEARWRKLTYNISWMKPHIVRRGRIHIEPEGGGHWWLRWFYHLHYWWRVRYVGRRLLYNSWRARRKYQRRWKT